MKTLSFMLVTLAFGLTLPACAPEIGDDCETSADCDVNGERICDVSLPGGYCTVRGCDANTCPDEARCVEFRPEPDRLSSTWCMASCGGNDDCRGGGYQCVHPSELLSADGTPLAVLLDGSEGARICAVPNMSM